MKRLMVLTVALMFLFSSLAVTAAKAAVSAAPAAVVSGPAGDVMVGKKDVRMVDKKGESKSMRKEIAIVLAQFGTSYPEALVSLTNIRKQVEEAFPGVTIRMAFTSGMIRGIWHKRRSDAEFIRKNAGIGDDILNIKAPLATLADLQDEGYKTIIVQPTHIFEGEEYLDLKACVDGLASIDAVNPLHKPFRKIALGRPLLGKKGKEYPYFSDIEVAAEAVRPDVGLAAKNNAALVYMGHGNVHLSTGIYMELRESLRKMYPRTPVYIGVVEGFPGIDFVVAELLRDGIKKVVLKPFMIVAGDHAQNDMAGDEEDSWKTVFHAKGIDVLSVVRGLGENPEIGRIFIQHIKDAARDGEIELEWPAKK